MKLLLCLLSACLAAVVLASPHNIHVARHHAVAARAAVAIQDDTPKLNRRSSRRCKNRPSSSVISSPTPVRLNPSPSTSSSPHVDYVPPTTVTTPYPVTTPTPQPTTTTPSYNSNLPSFMNGVQTGDGTFFDVGLGACGYTNQGTEFVVAVSHIVYDNYVGYNGVNSNANPICGKKIKATYEGKSVTVTVVDRCADSTCLQGNLDFSRSAFAQLASFDAGRIHGVQWQWV